MPPRIITKKIIIGGGGGSGPDLTDELLRLQIRAGESNVVPTDAATFQISLLASETNTEPIQTQKLTFPAGDFSETNSTPSETRSVMLRVWLSGTVDVNGSGVTNPGNADGMNDGNTCDLQSVALGSANPEIRSDIGTNIGAGLTFTAVTYVGWFRLRTTVATSTARVVGHSSDGSFADVTIRTLSAVAGDDNFLTTPFTFDLFAAGVDTLAKLQSLQIIHETIDAIAGTTPAILNADAGAADVVATSI